MAKAKMTYFKFHGLGEPVRFMMAYTGVTWEEELIEVEDFPKHKAAAILRHLARRAGDLYGVSEMDALLCDVAYDTITDLRMLLLSYFYEPHEESKAQKKKQVLEELLPMYLRNFEELVSNNGGHFVHGQLTWVDIAYAALIDYMSHMAETDLLADKPALRKLRDLVFSLPAIKNYIATRRKFVY
ncbi:hypothetical protein B566_EDAN001525 [Ephemera danica]|nr:hypothetical protein B566_EDAN001525 [Ephemera danica]